VDPITEKLEGCCFDCLMMPIGSYLEQHEIISCVLKPEKHCHPVCVVTTKLIANAS
jgi:hypothetical protein